VPRTDESLLWDLQRPAAEQAFAFWNTFMALAGGPDNNRSLSADEVARWLCIIRAVSWVESKHGSFDGANQGARDPMQTGHPADAWWKELNGNAPQFSRFVGGPGAANFDSNELPPAVAASGSAPPAALFSTLANPAQGHNDARFNPEMSYFWGVVWLVHRANTAPGTEMRFFKCGDCSRTRLIVGAIRYNGGGDPDYEAKIGDALALSGCL
jgi:hypothetical protein